MAARRCIDLYTEILSVVSSLYQHVFRPSVSFVNVTLVIKTPLLSLNPKSKTLKSFHGESSRALNKSLKSSRGEQLALVARGTFAVELYFGSGKDIGDMYAPLATIPADPTENFVDDLSVRHSMNPPAAERFATKKRIVAKRDGTVAKHLSRHVGRTSSLSENNSRKSRWTFVEFPELPMPFDVTCAHTRGDFSAHPRLRGIRDVSSCLNITGIVGVSTPAIIKLLSAFCKRCSCACCNKNRGTY